MFGDERASPKEISCSVRHRPFRTALIHSGLQRTRCITAGNPQHRVTGQGGLCLADTLLPQVRGTANQEHAVVRTGAGLAEPEQ